MELNELLADRLIKPKEKTELLSKRITERKITIDQVIEFAKGAKEAVKATCIEALEHATLKNPAILNEPAFDFVVQSLADKAPRVKWESARVVGYPQCR